MEHRYNDFFIRAGLATTFLYAAIASFFNPLGWSTFFPSWIASILPLTIVLFLFSVYELGLAFWLLSNKNIFMASVLSAFTLLGIILTNIRSLDIVFRDLAILLAAVGLIIAHWPQRGK